MPRRRRDHPGLRIDQKEKLEEKRCWAHLISACGRDGKDPSPRHSRRGLGSVRAHPRLLQGRAPALTFTCRTYLLVRPLLCSSVTTARRFSA
jgi:hypothetical protein